METNLDVCPTCGSELSQTKFREIRAKLRQQEDKREAELSEAKLALTRRLEQEYKEQFEQRQRAAEKKFRIETEQLVTKANTEREKLAQKLRAAEVDKAEIRKEAQTEIERQRNLAEKKAKEDAKLEAEKRIEKIVDERDLATKQLKEAKQREAQIRKQAEEQSEKALQNQLAEQRHALEKDKSVALLRLQSEFNRDRDSLQKKVKTLEHQIQKKTANELGDGGEINVFDDLRDTFQDDRLTRIEKGHTGADILHEVLYKGECCGRIVTDSKNRQSWQSTFISKLRQDQVEAGAEHAILATTVFPAGKKGLCIESGVIVVSPAHVVYIADLLRQAMITMRVKGLSLKERANKINQLYTLVTSESYSKKFTEAGRLSQDILDLDVQEQKDHQNVWRKRGTLATRLKNVLREVETDVAAVIEGEDATQQGGSSVETRRAS